MAEFLWTFAVQEVLKKLVKLAAEQIGVAWGLKKELSKLSKWLLKAEAILRDINRKKLHHESVRMWVEDLQHLVYEADDLLDELVYEDLRQKVETERTKKKVRNFFSQSNNPFMFRWKMAKKMKSITETLCQHYLEAAPLGLVDLVEEESIETNKNILKQIRETTSTLNFEVIGREVEVSNIVKLVIEPSNEHPISIIPIVGMGGLGKTTLAKMVFNHELVKGHFDKTIWVCVSEQFMILNILEGIFQTLTNNSSGFNSKENLLRRLQKEMQGKNYFLVLDDVWNEEACLWGELKDCLNQIAGKSGNSVIVTTRSTKVATIMETISSHHLNKLSDDQCWSLFKESANANGLLIMNPELEIIRKELVKNIGGVPLVAKVLGGAITFEGDYERWVTKVKSAVENMSKVDKDFVLSILKLSVDCLPLLSLKQCFAYCSNFSKDFVFHRENLIQMWIAQGFIQPQGDNVMLEDIGEGYFNHLLSRSLFQDVVKDDMDGTITHFKMHDLIHDVSCVISNRQKLELDLANGSKKGARKFRTLVTNYKVVPMHKLVDLLCLRVLVVDSFPELPNSIGMLKHLRYLEITSGWKMKLPESITMLYNLQTLKLGGSVDLPKNLRKLVGLRHLQFFYTCMQQMPSHMSQLIHLQTLHHFVVGFDEGCKIEELGPLKNLKGSLKLSHLERVKSKKEAINAKLIEKPNLRKLYFEWNSSREEDHNNHSDLEVLEGLQPHKNLRLLSTDYFGGKAFPNNIFVENLVVIHLQGCNKCEKLPMLGQLPNLEELSICSMSSVRSIESEFYGNNNSNNQRVYFPKLKRLSFYSMKNLEKWEKVTNGTAFCRLESLIMAICSKLMSIPDEFESLQVLRLLRCEELTKLPNGLECCKSLQVTNCPNLTNLNVHNMHNLKDLEIADFRPSHATIFNYKSSL